MSGFDLIKYNTNISIIFFISTIILFFTNNYTHFEFSNLTCLILILAIGITHGSLDNIKGKKLLKKFKIKNQLIFYAIYILLALTVVILWLILPSLTLFIFLIVASYHFGKEDSIIVNIHDQKIDKKIYIVFLLRGSLIIIAPLIFKYEQTISIFSNLFIENIIFFSILDYIYADHPIFAHFGDISILNIMFTISILAGFGKNYTTSSGLIEAITSPTKIYDTLSIIFLNVIFDPLIAFTIYFCFLHSPRHSLSLIKELDEKNFRKGLKKFLKKALPLTLITAMLFIISVYYLKNYYVLDNTILKVIFIGLASLTFPHILLEYLLEKNEK
jgi:Brp/Blh family beta-carotene 15,15'-monooxygenase